jgi:hypothetical protein
MEKIFILMLATHAGDAGVQNATPVWAIVGEAQCDTVAQILNANSDSAYVFCVPEAGPGEQDT